MSTKMSTENAMNAIVNIVCYKWKELANGEHPLMICVCKEGKRKYKSLGISIHHQYWDFIKNKPKRNCPNKDLIISHSYHFNTRSSSTTIPILLHRSLFRTGFDAIRE